jgi:phosphonate transport system substrate-binding protein
VDSYPNLVERMSLGQIDAAWMPPVVAMDCDAQSLAFPRIAMVRQAETSYHSTLFVPEASHIRSLADLVGLRAAWVSRESASGYLVPLASLRARGVSSSQAFSEHLFAGSHAEVARYLLDGKADIGANFTHFRSADSRIVSSSGWVEAGIHGAFRILAVAGPIPTDVVAFHRSMSEEHGRALARAFQWVMTRPEAACAKEIFACDGFTPCNASHVRGLRKLVRLLDRPGGS